MALRSNWYGLPKDWLAQLGIWLFDAHALKGIPQSRPDHHGVPYSLTEEFVSVYRLHPLIPDDYAFFDPRDGRLLETCAFAEIQGPATDGKMRRLELPNVLYSFGIAHPGALTLHNYPKSLQKFERVNGELIDLSVVDIVRDRRRGVPRYNDFRAALRLPRLRHWEELSPDPVTRRKLRDTYGKLDMVDTMIGLFAEAAPAGFGFSDTAFRIFILMASRRLQSDRFLTVDFRPEVYSPLGMDWIANNGMTSIVLRHCPELAASLPRTGNAFAPFRAITTAGQRQARALDPQASLGGLSHTKPSGDDRMAVVETERHGQVLVVRMNRPERLNALNNEMRQPLAETWTEFRHDKELEVAIFTGTGRGFCAGEDMKESLATGMPGGTRPAIAGSVHGRHAGEAGDRRRQRLRHGRRLHAGRAHRSARGGARSGVRGVRGEALAARRLQSRPLANLPYPIAMEMALGFRFTAERFYQVGFLNRLVPQDELIPTAMAMAEHLLTLPPASRVNTVHMMRQMRPEPAPGAARRSPPSCTSTATRAT